MEAESKGERINVRARESVEGLVNYKQWEKEGEKDVGSKLSNSFFFLIKKRKKKTARLWEI